MNVFSILKKIYKNVKIIFFLPLILFEVIYFLKNIPKISEKNVLLLSHWSYGHKFSSIDFFQRLSSPNKVNIITFDNLSDLDLLFISNVKIISFNNFFLKNSIQLNNLRLKILYLTLNFIYSFFIRRKERYFYTLLQLYNILPGSKTNLKVPFQNSNSKGFEEYNSLLGYYKLVNEDHGASPFVSNELCNVVKQKILEKFKNFSDEKLITIFLRNKGEQSRLWSEAIRNPKTLDSYLKFVKHLVDENYKIALLGDIKFGEEWNIDNVYDFTGFDNLTSFYLMQHSYIFIGNHSGPMLIPSSMKTPVIIFDCMPYWQGIPNEKDMILFKKCVLNSNKIELNKIMSEKNLFYSVPYNEYEFVDNDSRDMIDAFQEFKKILLNKKSSRITKSQNICKYEDSVIFHCNNNIFLN